MQERNHEVHPVGNKDKIERYDWKMLDQPGELRMLNKNEWNPGQYTAAVKRASMDLTRALAEVRR